MPKVLCFQNCQRARAVNVPLLRRITLHLLREFGVRDYELCIRLVTASEMARMNEQFLRHRGSTDVITFDYSAPESGISPTGKSSSSLAGEIFISVDDAIAQATQFKTTWQSEVVRYVIHGLLHLRGYDDLKPKLRAMMKRKENRLVKDASREFKISALARDRCAIRN